jgi:hypothetical protein
MVCRAVVSAAALLLVLAASRPAGAECAAPGIAVAPIGGESTNGVSWVFVPEPANVSIRAASPHDIETTIEKVSATSAFATFRVTVRFLGSNLPPRPRYTVHVDRSSLDDLTVEYRRAEITPEPPADRVRLESLRLEQSYWRCSYTNAVVARPSVEAPAYRIEWAPTEAAYRAGDRSVVVVPASMASFWRSDPETTLPALELGHVSCFGITIPEDPLAETVYLGIVPLGAWATPKMPAGPIALRMRHPPRSYELPDDPGPAPEAASSPACDLGGPCEERSAATAPFRARSPLWALLGGMLGFGLFRRLGRRGSSPVRSSLLP